jgi:hypothetical protein
MTTSPLHSKQTVTDGIHTAVSYVYADAAARLAATGFITEDLYKLAWQTSDATLWILTAITPTWQSVTSGVPLGRTLTAGAGLTGGGDLTADRTFDVVAHADGSITVNANDIQVGVLATDAQHGVRGGGTQHAAVIPAGASGFMTGADKSKLDVSAKSYLQWGNDGVAATTTTRYLTPGWGDGTATTAVIQQTVPTDGTLRNLRVRHNGTAGNGNAIVYTVRVNGVATALAVSLASTSSTGSDTTNIVAVVAGDRVDVRVTKALTIATSPSDISASLEVRA